MKKFLLIALTWIGLIAPLTRPAEAVPNGPSVVTVNGRQVLLQKRLENGTLAPAVPVIFKGVDWNPGTAAPEFGPDPTRNNKQVPYGFFFDGDWRLLEGGTLQGHEFMNIWLRQEMQNHYAADISLMAQMNVNTVRIYLDFGTTTAEYQQILDSFYNNNIMVILTVIASRGELDSGRYQNTVNLCKNHPAILMWSIGNEWNLNVPPLFGYETMPSAFAAVNQAAGWIKQNDTNHPVTSSLGDKFDTRFGGPCGGPLPGSDIPNIVNNIPNVDVWGINVFRGRSFGNLFTQWKGLTDSKPFYISEFGTDSFNSTKYDLPFRNPPCQDARGNAVQGSENQDIQAGHDGGLWNEISSQLSALDPAKNCIGGFVFEFNDEVWKAGDYNVSLGGLVDYDGPDNIPGNADDDRSYGSYNREGFEIKGAHPDDFANEEYFGLVNSNRSPKAAFNQFKTLYGSKPDVVLTKKVDKSNATTGDILTYTIQYTNKGLGDAKNAVISDPVPNGSTLVVGSISNGGTVSAGKITWTIGVISPGTSGSVSFQVQIP